MKAIKSQNQMKQLKAFSILSMLLFLFLLTSSSAVNAQESSSKSGSSVNSMLFTLVSEQFAEELTKMAPTPYETNVLISYSIPEKEEVIVVIYDEYGNAIKHPVYGPKSAGSYSENIGLDDLKEGIYYYRLTIGSYSDVKKIMIVDYN
jgi:hypothetical protein